MRYGLKSAAPADFSPDPDMGGTGEDRHPLRLLRGTKRGKDAAGIPRRPPSQSAANSQPQISPDRRDFRGGGPLWWGR